MKFSLTITCDNVAFTDPEESGNNMPAAQAEVGWILRKLARQIEDGCEGRGLHDSNGNLVGRCDFMD